LECPTVPPSDPIPGRVPACFPPVKSGPNGEWEINEVGKGRGMRKSESKWRKMWGIGWEKRKEKENEVGE